MTNDDLIKSIRGVVKEEIDTALEPVIKKLDGITDQLADVSEDVNEINFRGLRVLGTVYG